MAGIVGIVFGSYMEGTVGPLWGYVYYGNTDFVGVYPWREDALTSPRKALRGGTAKVKF